MDLPDELLVGIARFLGAVPACRLRLVCRRLRDILPALLPSQPLLYTQSSSVLVDLDKLCALGAAGLRWCKLGAMDVRITSFNVQQWIAARQAGLGPEHFRRLCILSCPCSVQEMSEFGKAMLGPGSQLISLIIFDIQLDAAAVTALAANLRAGHLDSLAEFSLAHSSLVEQEVAMLCIGLHNLPHLTRLDLSGCDVGMVGAQALSELLTARPAITHLNIAAIGLDDMHAALLSDGLRANTALVQLVMNNNLFDDQGGLVLAQALTNKASLAELMVHENTISNEAAVALAQVFGATPVAVADLSDCEIGPAGAAALFDAMAQNPTITTLSFSSNKIDGIPLQLGRAFQACAALRDINLRACGLGDEMAVAIADGIRANAGAALTNLELDCNRIGDTGAAALAGALDAVASITMLGLASNSIGEPGARVLAASLRGNDARRVRLTNNPVEDDVWAQLMYTEGGRDGAGVDLR